MLKNVFAIGLLCSIGVAPHASKAQSLSANLLSTSDSIQQKHWVDSVYKSLSWNKRIGQLFMASAYINGNNKHQKELQRLVKSNKIGGLIFRQTNPEKQVLLNNQLQLLAKTPLLIGVDLDERFDDIWHYPNRLTLGAIANDTLIYQMGADIAYQMKNRGIHLHFTTVTEINDTPQNPSIGHLSFGEDKKNIRQKTLQYIKGLQEHQVLACVKQFSKHQRSPTVDTTPLHSTYPFDQLINQELASFISPHLNVFIAEFFKNTTPTSKKDIFLEIKNVRKNIRKRLIKKENIEANVKKILSAKYRVGLATYQPINIDNLTLKSNRPESNIIKHQLYQKAITVVKNKENLLPFHIIDTTTFASLSLNSHAPIFHNTLKKYAPFKSFSHLRNKPADKIIDQLKNYEIVVIGIFGMNKEPAENYGINNKDLQLIESISQHSKVIINVFGNPYSLSQFQNFDHVLCAYQANDITQTLVPQALFGALHINGKLPIAASTHLPKQTGIPLQPIERLGYASPEMVGIDSYTLSKIDRIAQEAIETRATPGCQILVARQGKVIWDKAYGYHTYDSIKPVTSQSIYDIASITKVAASIQLVTFMEEKGLIDLDKKIGYYLTDLKESNKENMTIKDILTHQAGLWPYLPFWRQTMKRGQYLPTYYSHQPKSNFPYFVAENLYTAEHIRESVWKWVIESKIRKKEKNKSYDYKYSDMGYYMIHRLAEQILNQPIENFLAQNIYDPLGLTTLGFNPLNRFGKNRIAPTENDLNFRNTQVWGTVHDEGAALFGGVAGHAGLFSNATDLAILMQMHLQGGKYGGQRYFKKSTLNKFTSRQFDHYNRRGIGWDKPLPAVWYGPTSAYVSKQTFGHTGFTGTAVWVDPTFDLVFVFLSNRVYPSASNRKLIQHNIRTRIQDIVYQSIWEYNKYH